MIPNVTRVAMLATIFFATWAAFAAVARAPADPEKEAAEALRSREQEVLHTLGSGSPDERLEAADQIGITLDLGLLGRQDPSRPIDDLVDGLIDILRRETDDWIARTLLQSLIWDPNPEMNGLFREALHSGSVNVQVMAIRRLMNREDPAAVEALESLWEHDLPPWVRPHLIEALARQGSAAHLDDFMRLTRDDDPEIRRTAIEALGTLARPEAVPVLVRVTRGGTLADRAAAVSALGAFSGADEALEEVLRASRSDERSILSASIGALGRFGDPDGDDRLIALLDHTPDSALRVSIAEALEDSTRPDATAALVRLLHQRDVGMGSWVASSIVRVLHNRDDGEAVPGLLDLDQDPGENGRDEMGTLIGYLSRDRTKQGRTIIVSTHCGFSTTISAMNPRAWHVSPSTPLESIRCWDGPDRAGDPEFRPRIPAGTLVLISDHFEAPGRSWVEIEGAGTNGCWVPLDRLQKGPGPPEPFAWPRRHLRHEFDIGTRELGSTRAILLSEAGLLDLFEPGDEVAGVALVLDALEPDQVALVRALLTKGDTLLDAALRSVLREVDPDAAAIDSEDRDDLAPDDEEGSDDEDDV